MIMMGVSRFTFLKLCELGPRWSGGKDLGVFLGFMDHFYAGNMDGDSDNLGLHNPLNNAMRS